METTDLVLYYKPTCPYCQKVLSFMKEHDITVPLVNVDAEAGARQTLAEQGGKVQVPCLFIKGRPLYESDDIIAWMNQNLVNDPSAGH